MPENASGGSSSSSSLLIRSKNPRRCQAENPLKLLSEFAGPALSFQTEIAEDCGVEAAIIFANMQHWIKHNEVNEKNFRDGEVWTYNSRAAWCELFPYLGEKQIRNAIEKLVEAGLVVRGNFSGGNVNRTYWYRLGERAKAFGPNGQTKFGRKGQTITDDKPDEKQTIPLTPKGEPDGFEEVWKARWSRGTAPNPRQPALKAYAAALKRGSSQAEILAGVKARVGVEKEDTPYAPQLVTWLNQERWKDGTGKAVITEAELEASRQRQEAADREYQARVKAAQEQKRREMGFSS